MRVYHVVSPFRGALEKVERKKRCSNESINSLGSSHALRPLDSPLLRSAPPCQNNYQFASAHSGPIARAITLLTLEEVAGRCEASLKPTPPPVHYVDDTGDLFPGERRDAPDIDTSIDIL